MDKLIQKAAEDLIKAKHAVALTGAGISTESGIPDFRGPDGIWTKNPDAERKAYETYGIFRRDPKRYWSEHLTTSFWRKMDKIEPNRGHLALVELEEMGVLKAVLTQNIDNLHKKAGSKRVLEYHGSVGKLRCPSCLSRYERNDDELMKLKEEQKLPPRCDDCGQPLKSDVVDFQEPIPDDVASESFQEAVQCDAMIICGTSATVHPFATLPSTARKKAGVVIIEVNSDPTPLTQSGVSDYLIQGKTGEILPRIVEEVKKIESEKRK